MIELSAIWFILLIIYIVCIIFKIIKEEKHIRDGIKDSIKYIAIFVAAYFIFQGIGCLIGCIIGDQNGIYIGKIIGVSIFGIIFLGICAYGIYCNLKD